MTVLGAYALLVLVGVRLLSIGLREGYHPVHGRVGLAGVGRPSG